MERGRRLSRAVVVTLAVGVLAAAALAGVVGSRSVPGQPPRLPATTAAGDSALRPRAGGEGPRIPAFELARFDEDGTVRSQTFAGKPLVINFWASWCPFCVEEMPGFERVHREFGESVTFLGVGLRETNPTLARELVRQTGVTYELAEDPRGDLFIAVGGTSMPTTVLVTAEGRIADRIGRPVAAEELERLILEHLVERAE